MNPKQQAGGAFYEKHVCEEDRRYDRGCKIGRAVQQECRDLPQYARKGLAAVLALRVDSAEAQQIALDTVGGGEIVSQEVSSEGLWNEYSYEIINGDTWYDIEISGFGSVTELESVSSQYPRG